MHSAVGISAVHGGEDVNRWFIKPRPPAVSEQTSMLNESATRAHVASAALSAVEALTGDGGEPLHPQLIEEYRKRVHITTRVRDHGHEFVGRRQEHFVAALAAVAAGRTALVNLHRMGEIHDSILHAIEIELDLEELRLRHWPGRATSPKSPTNATLRAGAPVAQLDRAPGFEPGGRRFESVRAH
jgi:hypothetical protein